MTDTALRFRVKREQMRVPTLGPQRSRIVAFSDLQHRVQPRRFQRIGGKDMALSVTATRGQPIPNPRPRLLGVDTPWEPHLKRQRMRAVTTPAHHHRMSCMETS